MAWSEFIQKEIHVMDKKRTKMRSGFFTVVFIFGSLVILAAAPTSNSVEKLTFPISKNPLSLTFWAPLGAKQQTVMKSWDGIASFKDVENKTNIHLKFMHPPVGGEREQLNTMIAAQNLPDVIYYTNWDGIPGGPGKMIADGTLVNIDPLIKKYAPNLLAFWEKYPKFRAYTYTDEGECFGMPYYRPDDTGYVYHYGFVIRGDWAEKLGVKVPTNTDEWYAYLKAVRDKDPNANGKQDEIPFAGVKLPDLMETQRMFGIEPNSLFYLEKGQVIQSLKQPGYKEWLATMAKWYAEKLIDTDIFSTTRAMLDNKVLSDLAGSLWSGAGTGQLGLYMKQKQNKGDKVFSLNPVSIPTTKSGERLGWIKIEPDIAAGITTANKNPVETIKYFDYFFSDEGHMLSQLGPEGIVYNMKNGKLEFTDYATRNPDGLSFDSAVIKYGFACMSFVGYQVSDYWKFNISFSPQAASSDALWKNYTVYKKLNGLRFTADESSMIAPILNDINTSLEETVSKVIAGQWPLSKFDAFVTQADKLGMQKLHEIYKSAYERNKTR
jgi:putative aldouronate transport system substrate-binding protein